MMFPLVHGLQSSSVSMDSFEQYYKTLSPTYMWLMNETSGDFLEEVAGITQPFTSTSITRGSPGISSNSSATEYSYLFGGASDSYQITGVDDTFSGDEDFTLAIAFKLIDYTANDLQIICGSSISQSQRGFYIGYDNRQLGPESTNTLRVYLSEGATVIDILEVNGGLTDNNEHILVLVRTLGQLLLYLDGVLIGTETITSLNFNGSNDLIIGSAAGSGGSPITSFTPNAYIDSLGLWIGEAKDSTWVSDLSSAFFS